MVQVLPERTGVMLVRVACPGAVSMMLWQASMRRTTAAKSGRSVMLRSVAV